MPYLNRDGVAIHYEVHGTDTGAFHLRSNNCWLS